MLNVALSKAQRRVLKLLQSRLGDWVSRFELMGLGIVQYRERIRELRKKGFVIENKRSYAGKVRESCYRLVGEAPGRSTGLPARPGVEAVKETKLENRNSKSGEGAVA